MEFIWVHKQWPFFFFIFERFFSIRITQYDVPLHLSKNLAKEHSHTASKNDYWISLKSVFCLVSLLYRWEEEKKKTQDRKKGTSNSKACSTPDPWSSWQWDGITRQPVVKTGVWMPVLASRRLLCGQEWSISQLFHNETRITVPATLYPKPK